VGNASNYMMVEMTHDAPEEEFKSDADASGTWASEDQYGSARYIIYE